jgi:hypothetical protein
LADLHALRENVMDGILAGFYNPKPISSPAETIRGNEVKRDRLAAFETFG